MRLLVTAFLALFAVQAQPRQVLYVTHAAGFRHDSLPVSAAILQEVGIRSGKFTVTATEDLSLLSATSLARFDAVLFFTSGELPWTTDQKQSLLEFVRGGKGFGGFHSATDTLYQSPEYLELIGARFNGHPWTQEVNIDIEDPDHPTVRHLRPSFRIFDEIYQFHSFSRSTSHVLMTLDMSSVPSGAAGMNPNTADFPLAWTRRYGQGRVWYNALGHFDQTWRDPRFQQSILEAVTWLATPGGGLLEDPPIFNPQISSTGIGNAASLTPRMVLAAGSIFSIYGTGLTLGPSLEGDNTNPPHKLAGTSVLVNGETVPLFYVSPGQVNALLPLTAKPRDCAPGNTECHVPYYDIRVATAFAESNTAVVQSADATPGMFTASHDRRHAYIWATGLGAVDASGDLFVTRQKPVVRIGGQLAPVTFSGLAPGWHGLYQVNAEIPAGIPSPALLQFEFANYVGSAWLNLN